MQTFSTSNFTGRISCKSEKFVFLIKSPESSLLPLPNHLLNRNSLVCQKLEMDVVCHAIYWNREPDISYKARDYAETDPTLLLQRNSSLFHHIPQFYKQDSLLFRKVFKYCRTTARGLLSPIQNCTDAEGLSSLRLKATHLYRVISLVCTSIPHSLPEAKTAECCKEEPLRSH